MSVSLNPTLGAPYATLQCQWGFWARPRLAWPHLLRLCDVGWPWRLLELCEKPHNKAGHRLYNLFDSLNFTHRDSKIAWAMTAWHHDHHELSHIRLTARGCSVCLATVLILDPSFTFHKLTRLWMRLKWTQTTLGRSPKDCGWCMWHWECIICGLFLGEQSPWP